MKKVIDITERIKKRRLAESDAEEQRARDVRDALLVLPEEEPCPTVLARQSTPQQCNSSTER